KIAEREQALAGERTQLDERHGTVQSAALQLKTLQERLAERDKELTAREAQYQADRQALDAAVREHREDLARLARLRDALDAPQTQLPAKLAEADRRAEQLKDEARQLDEQRQRLAQDQARLRDDQERVRQLETKYEASSSQLAAQTATTEGQQTFLVAL